MGGQNNNDISLFQKIIFVDNIPNEEEAKRLSIKYPFCVFVTDDNEDGPNGITDNNPNGASSNMWKGGHRLTKFINVDPESDNIGMDTYSIKLTFDYNTGLLGITTVQKIEDYKLIGITYKKKNNNWRTFINKTDIIADIEAHRIGIEQSEWDQDEMDYDNLSYINENYMFDTIDAVDNKLYFIIRYFARDEQGLRTVPVQSFDIKSNNEDNIVIIGNPAYAEQKLDNILDGNSTEKEAKKNMIGKYTCRLQQRDSDYAYVDVMYELQLKDNSASSTQVSFSFGGLKDVFNPMNVIYNTGWINPLSFKLFIDDEEIIDNERSIYVMPGKSASCIVKMTPSNVRPLQLSLSEFTDGFINPNAALIYNGEASDNSSNTFSFSIGCPDSFTYEAGDEWPRSFTKSTYLKYVIKNKTGQGDSSIVQHDSIQYLIKQYEYIGLELSNSPWTPYGIATSGEQISFNSGEVYAKFADWESDEQTPPHVVRTTVKTRKVTISDTGLSINMDLYPKLSGRSSEPYNDNYDPNTKNIPNIIALESDESFITPWIKTTRLLPGETYITEDYIGVTYTYHGYSDDTSHRKYIKADILKYIYIASNGSNSIDFYGIDPNTNNITNNPITEIESGEIAHILRTGSMIEFVYNNGQIVDGYKWGYNSSLNILRDNIKIGLDGSALAENNHLAINNSYNNMIDYQSDDARDHANTVVAKLKYGNIESSDQISITVKKLKVYWYIYIGQITWTAPDPNTGNLTDYPTIPSGSYDLSSHKLTWPVIPGENDGDGTIPENANGVAPWSGQNTNGTISIPDHIDTDFVFYKGGWIYLGLKDDVMQRGSSNPLWEFSQTNLLMTADDMTDSTRTQYLIISPVGITWEDAFGSTDKDGSIELPQCKFAKDTYNMTVVPQEYLFGLLKGFNYRLYYKSNS